MKTHNDNNFFIGKIHPLNKTANLAKNHAKVFILPELNILSQHIDPIGMIFVIGAPITTSALFQLNQKPS